MTWVLGRMSGWGSTMAVSLLAHELGGASAVGVALVARLVPAGLAAPALALLADRWPRRRVLWTGLATRAGLLGAAAMLVEAGAGLVPVLVLAAGESVLATAHRPAHVALAPAIARTAGELGAVNVATSSGDYAGFLLGSVSAGLVVASSGVGAALWLAAAVAAGACVFLLGVPTLEAPAPEADGGTGGILSGISTVWHDPELRSLSAVHGANMVAQGMVDVLLVVTAIELLGTGEAGVGLLSGAWGFGGLLGGFVGAAALRRGRLAVGLLVGLVLAGLPLVVVGLFPDRASAVVLLLMLGIGFSLAEVGLLTMTQRLAADDVIGRVFGVQELLTVGGMAAGAGIAPLLVARFGPAGALVAAGLLLPSLAVVGNRRLRLLGAQTIPPARPYELLRGLEMLAPLPLATVETLAVKAWEQDLRAGDTVIEEGAVGDALFVVEQGALRVHASARGELALLGPGECVGEVALIRDQPRNATVTAIEPTRLVVVDRSSFLAAIGSHLRSQSLAEDFAAMRTPDGGGAPISS